MTEASTPLMRQYTGIKELHPNSLLFFRLGDFYELFFEDAITAARELEITLTSRNKEKGLAVPMCGVPYHAAESYIARLLRKGFKVAICDQMEDARLARKLVRREVTRVLTPGTAGGSELAAEENNFLAAVVTSGQRAGFAALDLSTGDFRATEFSGADAQSRLHDELEQLRPREVLYASSLPLFEPAVPGGSAVAPSGPVAFTPLEDWAFAPDYAIPLLENHFGVLSLEGFGLAGHPQAACAAGAVLHYLRRTQRGALNHLDRIGFYQRQDCLLLDAVSARNLELIEPVASAGDSGATLFCTLDWTRTPMGKRLLRAWLLRPSIDAGEINARLDAVGDQLGDAIARENLRRAFDGIGDIERLLSRATLEIANPRDLVALGASLARLPGLRAALAAFAAPRLKELHAGLDELADVRLRIEATLVPEPPLSLAEGGVIAAGADPALDELRSLRHDSRRTIAQIEERERRRTGIHSLKVKFNSVFGYYLEISKANLRLAPADYERKQTLVNAERFTTAELKEYEAKVLDAQEKIVELERRLFSELRSYVAGEARRIRQSALVVAQLDVLACFAHLAATRHYSHPQIETGEQFEIEIIAGRHPVIEAQESAAGGRFVPNDLYFNSTSHLLLLVTGPNMGGKSTYLRQTALIVLMAQMGSYVPAERARMGLVDRIFTRIGASDNLARGRSTFMVEMTETAAILHSASPRSLVLLDEIGRGTSTYDGLALAWATVEYLQENVRAKTLFATHYHELTALAGQLDGIQNLQVAVKEGPQGIIFLRKVSPGAADKSYGLEVARLAGLPPELIARARQVLAAHEATERAAGVPPPLPAAQMPIFDRVSEQVLERLRALQPDQLTPLDALNLLHQLKQELG